LKGARYDLNDDFYNLPWQMNPSGDRPSDSSLSAADVLESLEWMQFLDPAAHREFKNRRNPWPALPENQAPVFLSDLLKFGNVKVGPQAHLAVNWGDGSAVEYFGPDREALKADHLHYFASSGQYHVLLAVCSRKVPANLLRLIVQVRYESGEVSVMHPTDRD